ncbi:carotenoid oxygenase family protein [Desertimonas flava]|uniref:carotenoid oxygenase family protein n=1 Tax=Desertimonas flava TaxID=2064846 RepID=UPI000E34492E|nr:carotenoid oxygenase family protein [Desertimonas flava]
MGIPEGRFSRRDLARWSLFGGVSIGAVPACGRGGSVAAAGRWAGLPSTTPAAPSGVPWWLRDNFAPVSDEVDAVDLEVQGAIPPSLSGHYVRNGSNPAAGDSPHWFFGDGMVHGLRLEGGRATAYRNRYVRTVMYEAAAGFGEGPPGGASNQSNVSSIWHGGRLLTSGEVGLPYVLRPDDLSTVGAHDFAGLLTSSFTAHPKIDPGTGRMHSFGYGFLPPYLTYHVIEPDGTMSHTSTVDIPLSTMMHDFAITETDAVFWDLPVVFDLEAAVRFIEDAADPANFPYRWQPDAGARVGVMPLAGGPVQWFDIDPCYVFHGVNAARHGTDVVLEVCALSSMFEEGQVLGGVPTLRRWTLDTNTGRATEDVLEAERAIDLPTRDPRLVGRPYRYGYLVESRPASDTLDLGGVVKFDVTTGASDVWDPGPTAHGGEWLFVPADDDTAEDAGHLLGFLHDDATGVTDFVIIDATDVTAGPIARIALPQRVPYGFHAAWIPD